MPYRISWTFRAARAAAMARSVKSPATRMPRTDLPESTPIEKAAHRAAWSESSMPRGPRGEKRPRDVIGRAVKTVKILTGEIEEDIDPKKSAAAVELGSRGCKARASRLTPEQRKEIAKKAAMKRWQNRRNQST
jgi:hypothetical protein